MVFFVSNYLFLIPECQVSVSKQFFMYQTFPMIEIGLSYRGYE